MNIFVARLNYSTSSEDLSRLFEQYGEVSSAKVIMDRETGRSKGFAFVEMANETEAKEAIGSLMILSLWKEQLLLKNQKTEDNLM